MTVRVVPDLSAARAKFASGEYRRLRSSDAIAAINPGPLAPANDPTSGRMVDDALDFQESPEDALELAAVPSSHRSRVPDSPLQARPASVTRLHRDVGERPSVRRSTPHVVSEVAAPQGLSFTATLVLAVFVVLVFGMGLLAALR
ncbi:MAG: hypothetical protein KF819_10100 [Labilithrix sp.]|nr:hypothetical protein [Labilithrix sp.]